MKTLSKDVISFREDMIIKYLRKEMSKNSILKKLKITENNLHILVWKFKTNFFKQTFNGIKVRKHNNHILLTVDEFMKLTQSK